MRLDGSIPLDHSVSNPGILNELAHQEERMTTPIRKKYSAIVALMATIAFLSQTSAAIAQESLIKSGDRVVFLGDSNTYAGHYVADVDALLATSKLKVEVINVGLPSETCCGLSEPDHPFPRPTVQERIDRVLEKLKPDVVVACYGMNDGIYHPFSEDRFKRYQSGIKELITKVKKTGAKLILLTPPPFDPLPMQKKQKLVDKDSKQFAWFLIYKDYDAVLEKYSQWIMTLSDEVDALIDIRTPVLEFQTAQRKKNPEFTMSGDGVHFNKTCHRIIAKTLVKKLMPDHDLKLRELVAKLSGQKMQLLRDAWLTETGHKRPGMKKGLPVQDAKRKAAELDGHIQSTLK